VGSALFCRSTTPQQRPIFLYTLSTSQEYVTRVGNLISTEERIFVHNCTYIILKDTAYRFLKKKKRDLFDSQGWKDDPGGRWKAAAAAVVAAAAAAVVAAASAAAAAAVDPCPRCRRRLAAPRRGV
jgi:hypothetical protein